VFEINITRQLIDVNDDDDDDGGAISGAHPGRLTTMPIVTELLIEMVASGESVTVLPTWIVAPYLETYDLVTLQVGRTPLAC